MLVGIYTDSQQSISDGKMYFEYYFKIPNDGVHDYEELFKDFSPRFLSKHVSGWTNSFENYYGPLVNIDINTGGECIISQNTYLISDDFVSVPFNDLILHSEAYNPEVLKKHPSWYETWRNLPYSREPPKITDISDVKLNSLAVLIGIYDIFFPNIWPYKNLSFGIEWNGKNIVLDLGWLHTFLTSPDAQKVKSDTNDFLNALILQYTIKPARIANQDYYKDSPFVLSVIDECFTNTINRPTAFILSTIPKDYYSEYNTELEFNDNYSASHEEMIGVPCFDFSISCIRIPKSFLSLILHKLTYYVAFHVYHQYKQEEEEHDDDMSIEYNEERRENGNYDPKEMYEVYYSPKTGQFSGSC